MTILIISLAIFAIGLFFVMGNHYDWREGTGILMTIAGGLALVMCLLTIPMSRMGARAFISSVEAARLTKAVDKSDPIEGAAWRMYAAETNAELAQARYYNKGAFDIWWPDEIALVPPLK